MILIVMQEIKKIGLGLDFYLPDVLFLLLFKLF